jgi:hypothetical protein
MTTQFAAWRDEFLLREAMAVPPSTAPKYFGEPSSRDLAATMIGVMEREDRLRRAAEAMVKSEEYRRIGPHAKQRRRVNLWLGLAISALPGAIAFALIRYFESFGGFTQDGR